MYVLVTSPAHMLSDMKDCQVHVGLWGALCNKALCSHQVEV